MTLLKTASKRVAIVLITAFSAFLALALAPSAFADSYSVQPSIPFAEDSRIATKITSECTELGAQLSKFLQQFAGKKGVTVNLTDAANSEASGRNVVIEITDAVSRGNAFIGHTKYMEATAVLYVDGEKVAEKDYHRDSMGGIAGGYKSSCSVLKRTAKALGKDFSVWLKEVDSAG